MEYLHNYFYKFKEKGKFKIEFNTISANEKELRGTYYVGQYVRIIGSSVNDGIYEVVAVQEDGLTGITLKGCLKDEIFEGYICSLAIPKAFRELVVDIQAYIDKQEPSAMVSESFGGYSYTKGTINGQLATWQNVFFNDLKPYRRLTDGFVWVKEV